MKSQPMDLSNDYLYLIVEVAVTVYAFLLGLPTLVNQIFIPEDLRRMSRKNYTSNILVALTIPSALVVAIIAVAFPVDMFQFIENEESRMMIRDGLITVLFVAMLFFALRFIMIHLVKTQGYRFKIIEVIKGKTIDKYRKTGILDDAYLKDLDYLGMNSKPGAETRIVIDALEKLLEAVNENRRIGKDGGQFVTIIDILCNTVANSTEPGSRRNMIDVLTLYKSLLMGRTFRSAGSASLIYDNEILKIKDCTVKIAHVALKKDYSDMMPLVLNVLTLIPQSSDKLFEIGLMALSRSQFQIPVSVLAEIVDRDNEDSHKIHNYLGMAAHLYFSGPAARRYVAHSFKTHGITPTAKKITGAMEYFYNMSNFTTADKLGEMKRDIGSEGRY